jgi:hypothetical protein
MKEASESRISFNILFGDHYVNFKNTIPTFQITLQTESTLVRLGGRDSEGAPVGNITVEGSDEKYLVRLVDYFKIKEADIILDYSRANIKNIKDSNLFPELNHKIFYICPLMYDNLQLNKTLRPIKCITTFGDPNQTRRKFFKISPH